MSDDPLPENVTRQDFDQLTKIVNDLAAAQKELAEARTQEERVDAKEEVADARADLDALAKEYGLSPKKLREAAESARRSERKEELRGILRELLDEELPADEPDPEPESDEKPEEEEPTGEPDTAKQNGNRDSVPTADHWSQRNLVDVLKGR